MSKSWAINKFWDKKTFIDFLDYYYEGFPLGNVDYIYNYLETNSISVSELVEISENIQRYIPYIKSILDNPPHKTNLLSYALEIFLDENWDHTQKTNDRRTIIYSIKSHAGIIDP